jgi:hypothetical protein
VANVQYSNSAFEDAIENSVWIPHQRNHTDAGPLEQTWSALRRVSYLFNDFVDMEFKFSRDTVTEALTAFG